jgi:hypothetical protein
MNYKHAQRQSIFCLNSVLLIPQSLHRNKGNRLIKRRLRRGLIVKASLDKEEKMTITNPFNFSPQAYQL